MKLTVSLFGIALAMALIVSGCASVTTATRLNDQKLTSSDTPIAHINANNWGIYLLPMIPLITGSTDQPGRPAFVGDTVTVPSVVDLTTATSRKLGATKTTDLESRTSSLWLAPTLFLWYKSVEVSGNAVK